MWAALIFAMITYLKSTMASANAGVYTTSQSVPTLGWQTQAGRRRDNGGSYVIGIRHDDKITVAQVKRAAEATAILLPGDDATDDDWIFAYEDLGAGRIINRGRPPKAGEAAAAHIHLRVTSDRKSAYVRAAQSDGKGLSAWMQDCCDKAAGHTD